MSKKVWYCPKCHTEEIVDTKDGFRCAICRGKVFLAERRKHQKQLLAFNPETKVLVVKNLKQTCPKCKVTFQYSMNLSLANMPKEDLKRLLEEEGN